MFKLEFRDINDASIKFEVKCEELRIVLDTINFSDQTDYNVTEYIDYNKYEETDKLVEEPINFEVMVLGEINYDEFKSYIRQRNRSFLLKITDGDKTPRLAICKHYEETMQGLGHTDFYKWGFSVIRTTRWLELSTIGFDLNTENGEVGNYSNSDTFEDGYIFSNSDTFEGGMVYGASAQTLESFVVNLPTNDGDKYAYLRVIVDDSDDGFGFGLDNPLDVTNESFKYQDYVTIEDGQRDIIDSYPLYRRVTHIRNGVEINGQKDREFSRRTYLRVPLGDHFLEFYKVRRGSIILYKQYRLPF